MYIYIYIYMHVCIERKPHRAFLGSNTTITGLNLLAYATGVQPELRPIFILRILRPRIFESKFRNHCAKKLDGALRKPTSFV